MAILNQSVWSRADKAGMTEGSSLIRLESGEAECVER